MTIAEAVGSLPTLERRALTLRKVYDMSQADIAAQLGITPEEVVHALCEANRHMAEMIDLEDAT